jgi:hypothetical protein
MGQVNGTAWYENWQGNARSVSLTGYKEVNQAKLSKSDKAPIARAVDPYNPYESNIGRAMLAVCL